MNINGPAIYGTHPVEPYEIKTELGTWVFTENDNKDIYAIFIPIDVEVTFIPLPLNQLPTPNIKRMLGLSDGSNYKVNKASTVLLYSGKGLPQVWKLSK